MRIAVNTRLLLHNKLDGIGWFTYHTLKSITSSHPEVEFIFFFDRPWSSEFIFNSNVKPVELFPPARHPFLYYLWFEYAVPKALKKHKADLFLSPDGYLSLATHVPQLAVIHDLNFEHYPGDLPFLTRKYYQHYFPRFAQKANRIATVSEFSKSDIIKCYGIDSDKIDVVYNGVNTLYQPIEFREKSEVKEKYTNGCPYFLFVGMLHQRKNISNLLKAYDQFRKSGDVKIKLLIVGHRKWWTSDMEGAFIQMQFKEDVIFIGRQPIQELVKIVGAALAMVYVSTFEGFGVPIIEAMRSGVPVITSNVTAMPEVSQDAATLIDPFDIDSICKAMIRIHADPNYCNQMITKGIERSKDFSWEKTSALLWESILKTTPFK
ncbi:MAG: glycosyltransferase family 4 protein [Bacteroidetes bacterium]|nr:glycosyltransferase family 4 protein [Bacteroidota bacterium]